MQTFKINDSVKVECHYYETRNSWGHKAEVFENGKSTVKVKIVYLNRTWERYTYESVLMKALNKTKLFDNKEVREITNRFSSV